jgi:hypothetical protein
MRMSWPREPKSALGCRTVPAAGRCQRLVMAGDGMPDAGNGPVRGDSCPSRPACGCGTTVLFDRDGERCGVDASVGTELEEQAVGSLGARTRRRRRSFRPRGRG